MASKTTIKIDMPLEQITKYSIPWTIDNISELYTIVESKLINHVTNAIQRFWEEHYSSFKITGAWL